VSETGHEGMYFLAIIWQQSMNFTVVSSIAHHQSASHLTRVMTATHLEPRLHFTTK